MNPKHAPELEESPPASGPVAFSELEPPSGLRSITFTDGDARYLMISFPVQSAEPVRTLTSAESAVLQAVLEGRTNAAIARERGTAVRTVANQVASLFKKFGASSRLDLATRASSLIAGRPRP